MSMHLIFCLLRPYFRSAPGEANVDTLLALVRKSNENLSLVAAQLEVVKSWRRLIEIILLKYSENLDFLRKEVN